ncbi:MAG: tRNA pseudouridine(13) synthase TruD [Myxococcales bacterium]|nr:tRNA pseudouridine(13) synthase TruD [Myxococcales bacterium]
MNETEPNQDSVAHVSIGTRFAGEEVAYLLPWIDEKKLPRLAADLPPVGGHIKTYPEDFVVEEIPAYFPSGNGEFLYLWVEKRDLSGEGLLHALASGFGVSEADIGIAGVKDRRAVTRQWVSVPRSVESRIKNIENDKRIQILGTSAHTNKLRTGHLLGNRFSVLLRGTCVPLAEQYAIKIVERLNHGILNFYGSQRFGTGGETALAGLELIRNERTERTKRMLHTRFRRRFAVSAAQSVLFNHYLVERVRMGLARTVLRGDYMVKRASGGLFVADDVAVEQRRFDGGETCPTGPIFGSKMRSPTGVAFQHEERLLSYHGLTAGHFAAFGKIALGTRRALWIQPDHLSVKNGDEVGLIRVEFSLPSGSYATILLREFLDLPAGAVEDDTGGSTDE